METDFDNKPVFEGADGETIVRDRQRWADKTVCPQTRWREIPLYSTATLGILFILTCLVSMFVLRNYLPVAKRRRVFYGICILLAPLTLLFFFGYMTAASLLWLFVLPRDWHRARVTSWRLGCQVVAGLANATIYVFLGLGFLVEKLFFNCTEDLVDDSTAPAADGDNGNDSPLLAGQDPAAPASTLALTDQSAASVQPPALALGPPAQPPAVQPPVSALGPPAQPPAVQPPASAALISPAQPPVIAQPQISIPPAVQPHNQAPAQVVTRPIILRPPHVPQPAMPPPLIVPQPLSFPQPASVPSMIHPPLSVPQPAAQPPLRASMMMPPVLSVPRPITQPPIMAPPVVRPQPAAQLPTMAPPVVLPPPVAQPSTLAPPPASAPPVFQLPPAPAPVILGNRSGRQQNTVNPTASPSRSTAGSLSSPPRPPVPSPASSSDSLFSDATFTVPNSQNTGPRYRTSNIPDFSWFADSSQSLDEPASDATYDSLPSYRAATSGRYTVTARSDATDDSLPSYQAATSGLYSVRPTGLPSAASSVRPAARRHAATRTSTPVGTAGLNTLASLGLITTIALQAPVIQTPGSPVNLSPSAQSSATITSTRTAVTSTTNVVAQLPVSHTIDQRVPSMNRQYSGFQPLQPAPVNRPESPPELPISNSSAQGMQVRTDQPNQARIPSPLQMNNPLLASTPRFQLSSPGSPAGSSGTGINASFAGSLGPWFAPTSQAAPSDVWQLPPMPQLQLRSPSHSNSCTVSSLDRDSPNDGSDLFQASSDPPSGYSSLPSGTRQDTADISGAHIQPPVILDWQLSQAAFSDTSTIGAPPSEARKMRRMREMLTAVLPTRRQTTATAGPGSSASPTNTSTPPTSIVRSSTPPVALSDSAGQPTSGSTCDSRPSSPMAAAARASPQGAAAYLTTTSPTVNAITSPDSSASASSLSTSMARSSTRPAALSDSAVLPTPGSTSIQRSLPDLRLSDPRTINPGAAAAISSPQGAAAISSTTCPTNNASISPDLSVASSASSANTTAIPARDQSRRLTRATSRGHQLSAGLPPRTRRGRKK